MGYIIESLPEEQVAMAERKPRYIIESTPERKAGFLERFERLEAASNEELERRKQPTAFEQRVERRGTQVPILKQAAEEVRRAEEEGYATPATGFSKMILRTAGEGEELATGLVQLPGTLKEIMKRQPGESQADYQERLGGTVKEIGKGMGTSLYTSARHLEESFKGRPITTIADISVLYSLAKSLISIAKQIPQAKALIGNLKATAGKGAATELSASTGIPLRNAEYIINYTDDVFNKANFTDDAFLRVGKKAQRAVNEAKKLYGAKVAQETRTIKDIVGRIPVDDVLDDAERAIEKATYISGGKVRGIPESEIRLIRQYMDDIANAESAGKLHKIKLALDNEISYTPGKIKIETYKPATDRILSSMRGKINNKLRALSEPYAQANDDMSRLLTAYEAVDTKLKGVNVDRGIKSALKTEGQREALQALDDAVPSNLKFMRDAEIVETAQMSRKPLRRGGGFGTAIGAGIVGYTRSPSLAALIGGITSPFVRGKAAQVMSGITKAGRKIGEITTRPEMIGGYTLRQLTEIEKQARRNK